MTNSTYSTTNSSQLPLPLVHPLSCFRQSPRPCINQALVDELKPLREWRFLNHGTQSEKSISYATAISVIIGTPYLIETVQQAKQLPKIVDKLIIKIEEFLNTGRIQDSHDKRNHWRMEALRELTSVYGIGYNRANDLIDVAQVRSIEQLSERPDLMTEGLWRALKYRDDMERTMSRALVEEVAEFIRIQLERVEPGAHTELCGGYRRGKESSNDVDLMITYPHEDGKEKGVLRRLLHRLKSKGLIPEDGVLTESYAGSQRTIVENRPASKLDSLDRAFVVFKHWNQVGKPADEPDFYYRRVDLIVTCWKSWGSAIVGWTGSTQFERDLRSHAHSLDYKFDSGGIRRRSDDSPVPAMTEKDVFRALKVPYLPPHLRNADP